MVMVCIRRNECGFTVRLGNGIVNIESESVMRQRLGLKPDKWDGQAVEAVIRKVGNTSFLLNYTDTKTGYDFAKVYKSLEAAMQRLARVQFEIFKAAS